MPTEKWNVWLLIANERPLAYMTDLTELETREWASHALAKMFDGADADAVIITRSDQGMPLVRL